MDSSQEPKNVVKATLFNEIADKFSSIIQEGNVYVFCGADVKPKNSKFNQTKHDVEVIFNRNTTIEVSDDSRHIPTKTYDFTPIEKIQDQEKYAEVDVLACLLTIGDERTVNLKSGGTSTLKEYTVYDESCFYFCFGYVLEDWFFVKCFEKSRC